MMLTLPQGKIAHLKLHSKPVLQYHIFWNLKEIKKCWWSILLYLVHICDCLLEYFHNCKFEYVHLQQHFNCFFLILSCNLFLFLLYERADMSVRCKAWHKIILFHNHLHRLYIIHAILNRESGSIVSKNDGWLTEWIHFAVK